MKIDLKFLVHARLRGYLTKKLHSEEEWSRELLVEMRDWPTEEQIRCNVTEEELSEYHVKNLHKIVEYKQALVSPDEWLVSHPDVIRVFRNWGRSRGELTQRQVHEWAFQIYKCCEFLVNIADIMRQSPEITARKMLHEHIERNLHLYMEMNDEELSMNMNNEKLSIVQMYSIMGRIWHDFIERHPHLAS